MTGDSFDIAQWDETLSRLSSRAEHLRNASSTFAPTIFLEALRPPKDQIVYGRRGTGETHLFRRLEAEYPPDEFERHRTIIILIDATSLSADSYGELPAPQVTALDLFSQLVKRISGEISNFLSTQLDPSRLERTLGKGKARQLTAARRTAISLTRLIETGEVHYLPVGEASQTTKTLRETVVDSGLQSEINLADLHAFAVKLKASAGARRSTSNQNMNTVEISGRSYLPFVEIAKLMRNLVAAVSTENLVIMIDEWSTLDDSVQPYLAQLLKRMRQTFASATSHIHFKLACVPTRTRLSLRQSSRISIGMEEGDDIFPDADLDQTVYFDRENDLSLIFLQDVLKRHAGQSLEWVRLMEKQDFMQFINFKVFLSPEVFSELCWASAGVPRDFLDLISKATRAKVARNSERIEFEDIRAVARPAYEAKIKDVSDSSISINREVFHKVVYPNRSYAEFLLTSELARLPDVSALWVERLWHLSPQRFVDQETGLTYERYRLDYGMYVDLITSQAVTGQGWASAINAATVGSSNLAGSVSDSVMAGSQEAARKARIGAWSGFLMSEVNQDLLNSINDARISQKPIGKPTLVEPKNLIADSVVRGLAEHHGRSRGKR